MHGGRPRILKSEGVREKNSKTEKIDQQMDREKKHAERIGEKLMKKKT